MTEGPDPVSPPAPNWRESAVEFVSARLELFSYEAKEAGKSAGIKAGLGVFAVCCGMVAWLAVVAGLIGWVASAGVAWYFATLGAAFLHLLAAGIAVMILRRPAPPAFQHTKEELSKDREWLLQKNKTSKP